MTELIFNYYHKHHSGRTMARMQTTGFYGISFNAFADEGSDMNLSRGTTIMTSLHAEAVGIMVFPSEEAYLNAGSEWDSMSVEPYGALAMFAKDAKGKALPQEANMLFTGRVTDVIRKSDSDSWITVETLEMIIHLHAEYDGCIESGYYVQADAVVYGKIG